MLKQHHNQSFWLSRMNDHERRVDKNKPTPRAIESMNWARPLSHSSIIASEYGIPAVVSTGIATRRIKDGQTITVNGSTGTVELN